jgi:hypothetical protein
VPRQVQGLRHRALERFDVRPVDRARGESERFERAMAQALDLPWHLRPVMLIALGYPDPQGGVPFSAKKPSQSLLRTSNDYTP